MHAPSNIAVIIDAESVDLAARAASGDAAAFEELVRCHHASVIRWAIVAVGDLDDAEDLAQAVWMRAYRSLGDYRGAAKFSTWLYRITYNLGFEVRRTRDRRLAALATWNNSTERVTAVVQPHDEGDAQRLAAAVHACVKELPPRQAPHAVASKVFAAARTEAPARQRRSAMRTVGFGLVPVVAAALLMLVIHIRRDARRDALQASIDAAFASPIAVTSVKVPPGRNAIVFKTQDPNISVVWIY